jgi:hypothetical protein
MEVEGTYLIEVTKLMEYVESKEDSLVQILRTHLHNTNPTLFQTLKFIFRVKQNK